MIVVDGEPVIRVMYGCDTESREDVLLTRREWILATVDTKLQMFESLNFVQKITNHQITKPNHNPASVGIISEGEKQGR